MLVARADQEHSLNAICAAYLRATNPSSASVGRAILQARYYDGSKGQFLSEDPTFWGTQQNLKDPQSLNSYSYGNGNPITNSDPKGLIAAKLGGQYTIPGWGLTGSAGISFDQYGVDYYYGAGLALGGGGSATAQVSTETLSHTYSVSTSVFGGIGTFLNAEVSRGMTYYPYSLRKPEQFDEMAVGVGAQLSVGGIAEVSGPLLKWGQRKNVPMQSPLAQPLMVSKLNLVNTRTQNNNNVNTARQGSGASQLTQAQVLSNLQSALVQLNAVLSTYQSK